MPRARPAACSARVSAMPRTRRPIHASGNETGWPSTTSAGDGVGPATSAGDGVSDGGAVGGGPRAPTATTPTSSSTGAVSPRTRSRRRMGDRGLVGTGSTIIVCRWYVAGRPPDAPALRYCAPMARNVELRDVREQSFWQATMPELPDRRGGTLRDTADVVVIGGGMTG